MTDTQYKKVPVDSLIPYARNARTHSDQQVGQIAASIREFGFLNPVIIDGDNGIVAGHGRVMAAQKLGIKEVPCIEAAHLTEAQRRAYVIADNKIAMSAGWDDEILSVEFADLEASGFDLELTGFSLDEIAGLGGTFGDSGPAQGVSGAGSLAGKFMVPPFTVLSARDGWWQNRKRAWLALGIRSEVGRGGTASTSARRGENDEATYSPIGGKRQAAAPGGSARPACDYSKKQRGNGAGRAING